MAKGVSVNKRAIAKMHKDIQREFDKRTVQVPIKADATTGSSASQQPTVNHYHAPVVTVNGDQAQVAWGNGTIN